MAMEEVYLRIFLMQVNWNQESPSMGWSVTSPLFSFLISSQDDICRTWVTVTIPCKFTF